MTHTLYCKSANRFGEDYDCICPKPAEAEPSNLPEAAKQRIYELESALAEAERRLEDAEDALAMVRDIMGSSRNSPDKCMLVQRMLTALAKEPTRG